MSMRVCMVGLVHEGLYGGVMSMGLCRGGIMSMRVCMVGLCPWDFVWGVLCP